MRLTAQKDFEDRIEFDFDSVIGVRVDKIGGRECDSNLVKKKREKMNVKC